MRVATGPKPIVDRIDGLYVVRDDFVPGGTKARIAHVLWAHDDEVVFPSPAEGCAQIALGYTATRIGKRATIFTARRNLWHENTVKAERAGARIEMVRHGRLSTVRARAREYARARGARLMPLGLDAPELRLAVAQVGRRVAKMVEPTELWVCAGSGVLAQSLRLVWPDLRFCVVQIGREVNPAGWLEPGRDDLFVAPEAFGEVARRPPPFPSCANYDAKIWQFSEQLAKPGALYWNVAA